MNKIVYYVASSLDGRIAGHNDDISGFVGEGSGLDKYLKDLAGFKTVIMGRNTYEFGYKFGIEPGQPAYPHMKHYIFSNTLTFENQDPSIEIKKINISEIEKIRQQADTDIYLCGGGQFAGWLLENQQIDELKVKLNPLILGRGIKIFGDSKAAFKTKLTNTELFDFGLQIMTYTLIY
ncbi:MAG TPA: dihydrofolate reductase family protein [Eudoraea sp.]|nr:dihydrofolate reductase family protein [Eudoraea sp.]